MLKTAAGLGLAMLAAGPALAAPAPAPVLENDQVIVWDVRLAPGETAPPTPHDLDTVVMFVEGGTIRSVMADGKSRTVKHDFGDAVFVPKGSDAVDTLVSGGPAHEVVVGLKPHREPPAPNTTGLPLAFPREGSVKVLENDKVVVWHYNWLAGRPTPMHFHDKAVVLAYRYDGTVTSTTPDGTATPNAYKAGEIRFNPAKRVHTELLTTDRQSAVMMELK